MYCLVLQCDSSEMGSLRGESVHAVGAAVSL